MNTPSVSVILPAFNAEKTIADTLHSVFQQSVSTFEIIVVDDGSTDQTNMIVSKFATRDERLTLITQANQGIAPARNAAIAVSKSDVIAPIDADDLWHPMYLETQLHALEAMPGAAVAYAWSRDIDPAGHIINTPYMPLAAGHVFSRHIFWNMVSNGSAMVFKKCLASNFGFYDKQVTPAEDLRLQLNLASRYSFAVSPKYLVGYRKHASQTSRNNERMYQAVISILNIVEREFSSANRKAVNWKRGEVNFVRAMHEIRSRRVSASIRYFALASWFDPPGTALGLAYTFKQWAKMLGRRAVRNELDSRPATLFLTSNPAEIIAPSKPSIISRRLAYLQSVDQGVPAGQDSQLQQ